MSEEYQTQLRELLTPCQQDLWERLSSCVEERYDMDILWNKGFGSWVVEKIPPRRQNAVHLLRTRE